MEIVQNEVLSGKAIVIDDKMFVNGKYTNCTLLYSGGEFSAVNTSFDNCKVNFAGAAQRTAALLGNLGILPPGGAQPPAGGNFGFPKKPDGIQ